MKLITYTTNAYELSVAINSGLDEVIISHENLGRFSRLNTDQTNTLIKAAYEAGIKVTLEWDILINECDFNAVVESLSAIDLDKLSAIRVQDIGALNYVLENTQKKVQLICENNNHNLVALKTWQDYIGDRLDRLVISPQLAKDKIEKLTQNLSAPIELLGLGRVLLFYSPRKLLSPYLSDINEDEFIEATGESEESPHKGFPIIQNKHGSFMFHIKDLFLLDKLPEIKSMGVDYLRLDLRFNDFDILKCFKADDINLDIAEIKKLYNVDVIRGYFQVNKSDVLFKKLKNYRLQRKDESYIGEVLETIKGELMAINISGKCTVKLGDQLKFITPEGKEHSCKVHQLKNPHGDNVDYATSGDLALINYMSGVWTKSQVYFQ